MEWYGIDLSHNRQQIWLKKTVKNAIVIVLTTIITITISIWIWLASGQLHTEFYQTKDTINKLHLQIADYEQQIHQIKQHQQNYKKPIYLKEKTVEQFIAYIQKMPIQGIIEIAYLYIDEIPKLKLVGKIKEQTELEKITKQLNQLNYSYKVDNFKINEQSEYEFILIIALEEEKNEKLDTR
ncbi:hypothetical protein A1D29_09905 [Pasteurellaceae bacterium Orientalotternb1]|nr:hypothetical protein A1D29_09905 [Pasteurellaceae bacterium Orientalotternb1]